MQKNDNVFFFVLIDFLLQICFFGLLLFAAIKATEASKGGQTVRVDKMAFEKIQGMGFSNLTELTDKLTTLVPLEKKYEEIVADVEAAGGLEKVKKIAKQGVGKPACREEVIGTVTAFETFIVFEGETPALKEVLTKYGMTFPEIQRLSFSDFEKLFSPIVEGEPHCRYKLNVIEKTRYTEPRDTIRKRFHVGYLSK